MQQITKQELFFGALGWRGWLRQSLMVLLLFTPGIISLVHVANGDIFRGEFRSLTISWIIGFCCALSAITGSWLYSAVTRHVYLRKYQKLTSPSLLQSMIVASLFVPLGMVIGMKAAQAFTAAMWNDHWQAELADYRFGIFYFLLTIGFLGLFNLYRETLATKNQIKMELKEQELQSVKIKLAALTQQMSPHMLFNTLNGIAATITTDPEAAEAMTIALSDLYRRILIALKKQTHSIVEELQICTQYLRLQQFRFGDRLGFDISYPEGLRFDVPVLTLQPLVENAVKHGVLSKKEGGFIWLRITDHPEHLEVVVEDDGVGWDVSTPRQGTKTGIDNLKTRLRYLYGDASGLQLQSRNPCGAKVLWTIPKSLPINPHTPEKGTHAPHTHL